MPGGGLTTTMDIVLSNTDRFIRNYRLRARIESKNPSATSKIVHVTTFSSAAGETPATDVAQVDSHLSRRDHRARRGRFGHADDSLRAGGRKSGWPSPACACEGSRSKPLAAADDAQDSAGPSSPPATVLGVLNTRLIRKLCEKCKEAYPPPAEVLKQLGLPAGRIESLAIDRPRSPSTPNTPRWSATSARASDTYGRTAHLRVARWSTT